MPYLAREQENTASILALYARDDNGLLYDPDTVEFRIIYGSTQVFPVSGYEDVTTDGRADKGVFYAFDAGSGLGWAPDVAEDIGEHTIQWRYTDSDGLTTLTWSHKFDVYESGTGLPFWTYVTPNDIREEGITTSDLDDTRLIELICDAQSYIERMCRQPFRPVRDTIKCDGNGSPALFLPVPIIAVDNIKINGQTTEYDTDLYTVYKIPAFKDDPGWNVKPNYKNPRIKLLGGVSVSASGTIFSSGRGNNSVFHHLPQGQAIKGVFGRIEPDGTTPKKIRQAALMLVLGNAPLLELGLSGGTIGGPAGPITRERTDRHEVEFAPAGRMSVRASALSTSREVEEILNLYRAPMALGSPATTWQTAVGFVP